VKEKASKLLRRVNWLKLAKRGSGVAFNALTGLPSPDQIEIAVGALQRLGQDAANIDGNEIPGKIEEIAGFLNPAEDGDNLPDTIHQFREDFKDLLNEAKIKQLVVLIDDLDRCLPTTAIQTLEAIRLFLFVPKSAFVIGADEAMIEYAVRQHFPDLPVASGPLPYARNYLEKLIQVPFRIPSLGAQETRIYVTLLLVQSIVGDDHDGFEKLLVKGKDSLREPWHGVSVSQTDVQKVDESAKNELNSVFVLAQQIAPILAEGTKGNPRQIKRFLNALLVRQVIAKARGFSEQIKQPVLAKLMLAERFQPDFYEHVSMQAMSANDGKVSDLAVLESTGKSQKPKRTGKDKGKGKITDKGSGREKATAQQSEITKWLERDWLKRWLQLEPELATEDLRPYVFVARDRRSVVSALAEGGLETLIAKLCGAQLEIRAAEPEVKSLSAADAGIVFNGLRERVLGVGSFVTAPGGIDGLAIVAKHHAHLQSEVVALLDSFDPKDLGLWVVRGWNEAITEKQARGKLIDVIRGWGEQNENTLLKSAALSAVSALEGGVS
ncbi:MAG: NTPase KAP, partial [Chloroflexi bacterium]|nr:NTPase KAP [Chloroflexota bacterium]